MWCASNLGTESIWTHAHWFRGRALLTSPHNCCWTLLPRRRKTSFTSLPSYKLFIEFDLNWYQLKYNNVRFQVSLKIRRPSSGQQTHSKKNTKGRFNFKYIFVYSKTRWNIIKWTIHKSGLVEKIKTCAVSQQRVIFLFVSQGDDCWSSTESVK